LETQATITEWAKSVGIKPDILRAVMRAKEEMDEALVDISRGDIAAAGVELADVVICLHVAASLMGVDLQAAIDTKMQINRNRTWRVDATGCAYHVKTA